MDRIIGNCSVPCKWWYIQWNHIYRSMDRFTSNHISLWRRVSRRWHNVSRILYGSLHVIKDMSNNRIVSTEVPGQCADGMYRIGVVDSKTHKVKYMSPWRHNLILNSGMYAVATKTWMSCCRYCYLGGGSTAANYEDSSTDTAASDASGNVTSVGVNIDFTTFANGDCILFDDGSQGRIMSRPTANSCTIVPEPGGAGIASQEFTVLRTSRTQLTGTVLKKVSTYLAGIPNQQVSLIHNATTSVITNRQTYDFAAEVGAVTYNEIGITWSSVTPPASPILFSRIVLPVPLTLGAGDYARVVYQLSVTISPTNEVTTTPDFDNDGTPETGDGNDRLYNLGLSVVNIGNTTVGFDNETPYSLATDSYSNEPCMVGLYSTLGSNPLYTMWLSYTAGVHTGTYPCLASTWGNTVNDYIKPFLLATTTENLFASGLTYSHNKVSAWTIGQGNTSSIGAFGIGKENTGSNHYPQVFAGLVHIYSPLRTKLNTQTLTLRIKYSWSRTLTID